MKNIAIVICFFSFSLFAAACDSGKENRPEYTYSERRANDELDRLEQNMQIEEVLGHDVSKLKMLLGKRSATNPEKMRSLLIECRDEYIKGLKNKSGVPLGGMGAGTIELWPDGKLRDWRISGNWDLAQEPEFSCFAIRTEKGISQKTRILQEAPLAGRRGTEDIKYEGRFPFAFLDYGSGNQPIAVKASAFSPFIPHNADDSCLPLACFTFTLTNISDDEVRASVLFAVGASPFLKEGVAEFETHRALSTANLASDGNSIALSSPDETISFAAGWTRSFLPPNFEKTGKLTGDKGEKNGRIALCSEVILAPKQSRDVLFLLSWYFPDQRQRPTASYHMEEKFKQLGTTQKSEANKFIGRRYNKFGSLKNINDYFYKNIERLKKETLLWINSIYDSNLDAFLKSLLCNSLYPLFKTSFWTEAGLFNILESTNCCANPDCVHVRYYGSIPLALLFPELDKQILRRLAKYRGPFGGEKPGQIPEQFYGFSLELPFGRPLLQNNLSFVLMVCRDYLWTGDAEFLEEMWPAVQEAMALVIESDTDNDGLPDNVGRLQSYDDYNMGDSPTYTSVLWLASLRAAEEIALVRNEPACAESYRALFETGQKAVEETLWNGQYYGLAEGEDSRICFADALNGQWYADMLGLGDLLDPERIRATLAAIFKYNHSATNHGIVNGFIPGVGIDYPKQAGYYQTQTASVWTGTTFAVASMGLYRGFYEEPLEAVRQTHHTYAHHLGNLWNMRESVDAESGLPMAWPFYYRPMSAWSVLLGLEGFGYNATQARLTLKPPPKADNLKAPLVVPGCIGELEFARAENGIYVNVSIIKGLLKVKAIHLPPMSDCSLSSGVPDASLESQETETIVRFPAVTDWQAGETLHVGIVRDM